ncbi:hypothetical protein [Catellatospora bangladeshensis]|uniref:Tetratricopeptide repeat protein n=1 Tax=Catellatospora bangladeshensis TaxID=310355 RepID=A0A8J3JIR8_9ACTN|nr:hypothetical protein [Catellatospora bangladeshensis]GIF81187.1 hypothetical protein Cba03nite_25360 [Catellatospora bangladeshensis]
MSIPTPDRVRELIEQCWQAQRGAAQLALAEEAIAQADALGDDLLRFHARMAATEAYQRGGRPAKGFVTFSWCLARYDARPERYGDQEYLLLWHYKYMVNSLTRFPDVPLARTYAVLDDMQQRYQQGGHSLQTVHKHRWLVAFHLGDDKAADLHYERWQVAPRDGNSDCVGCDPTDQVLHLAARGRDEEAIALTAPVLAGRLTCVEQPQEILTALLLPYLRTGRLDEARRAHHQAYRSVRDHRSKLGTVAEHVYFLAVSGNAVRGLELVERHLPWLDEAPSPFVEMDFAAAAALVLRLLADAGHGDQAVRGAEQSVAELAARLATRATALSRRFDTRNGTAAQGDRIAAVLAARPLVEHLPLSLAAQPAVSPPRRPDRPRPAADPLPDVSADAELDELLELIEEALRRDEEPRADALWQRISPFLDAHWLTALQRGRLADLRGMRLHGDAVAETEEAWTEALEWYAKAGDDIRAQRIRGRLGLHRSRHGQPEEGLAQVRASTEHLLAHGEAKDRAGALRRLAVALLHAQQPAEAMAELDRIAAVGEPDPGPRVRLQVLLLRAQALGADGRVRESADAARELIAQASAEDQGELVGLGEFFLGQGLSMLDDSSGAVQAFDRALSYELPEPLEQEVRERRAVLLAGTVRAREVVDDLAALVARLTAEQRTGGEYDDDADHSRFHLAVALFNAGRPEEAAEVGEEAVYGADRAGNQNLADQVRHLLAAIYQRVGDTDQALSYLDQLAVNLDGFDNAAARARVLEQAGELLFDLDRDGLAAQRLGSAASVYRVARLPLDELRARRRQAVSAMYAEEPEQARQAVELADAAAAALPPGLAVEPEARYELAWLALDGARAMVAAGDPEAALSRVRAAPDRFRELEAFGEAFLAELATGEVLLTLGRAEAAEPLLRSVLNGLPRDSATLPRAAYALAHALLQSDRADEAQRLAGEYGFELD